VTAARGLPPVAGHARERAALARAFAEGRLPQSLLLHGARGVGKQRVGLWLGQLLMCEAPAPDGPCGDCRGCRLARRLEHPDLHWFFPLPRPRGASGTRLASALEDARAARLQEIREDPLAPRDRDEVAGIYLAQVHAMKSAVAARPAMARRRFLLVGEAQTMVPQEASPEAANAFLKLLEEPPPDTWVVLTTAVPDALLPTIRSRMAAVRLGPVAAGDVSDFLRDHRGADEAAAEVVAGLAGGSIGRALELLAESGEGGGGARQRAARLVDAALADDDAERWAAALAMPVAGSRGEFAETLDLLAGWFRDIAALRAAGDVAVLNADHMDRVRAWAVAAPRAAERSAEALAAIDRALEAARRNADPQLVTLELLDELHGAAI
jgi:DNA polymerase-3 subunit delta'